MKNTWKVLLKKAEAKVSEAQANFVKELTKMNQLKRSILHIEKLKADYLKKYKNTTKKAHNISDDIGFRNFLEHLESLKKRTDLQIEEVKKSLEKAIQNKKIAIIEQTKMEVMIKRDLDIEKKN